MKKFFCIVILLAIALSFGCDRYPDGPLISFRSVQKRLEGNWQVVGYTSDGVDSLQNYNDSCGGYMKMDFPPDWNYVDISFVSDANKPFKGNDAEFCFSDHYTIMNLIIHKTLFKSLGPIGGNTSDGTYCNAYESWKILKLEKKALKISTTYNGRSYLISFKKE
ncbi:MAG: hypothetical protein ABR968_14535 [Bacteroidales bacterium]